MADLKKDIDLVLLPQWLVPMTCADAGQHWLTGHGVAIDRGRIVAVASHNELLEAYSAKQIRQLDDHVLIPGLVNAHTHSAMSLLRGFADDMALQTWLSEYIWPAEGKWVSPDFVRDGTNLAIAEMIRGGTTCFNDMYFFPDIMAACAEHAGMRASVGMILIDFPTAWAADSDEYLNKGLALRDNLRHSSLVSTMFAPHAPYTVSDEPLRRIATLSNELECRIHIHLHETAQEVEESMARFNMRPIERLDRLGLLGPNLSAVHMTQLLDGEITSIAERGVTVIHCPESNLKLASGQCPVQRLCEAGVNVAIGTDGAASNNDLDMLGEMRSASLLAKLASSDPSAMPAGRALYSATLGGAKALGLDHQIGSVEVGKFADLAAINLADPSTQPLYNPVSQLVYAASRNQVSDVWIGGKSVLKNGNLTTIDQAEVLVNAGQWGLKLSTGATQSDHEQNH